MEESGPSALQGSVQYHHQWQTLVNEAEALRNARRGDLLSEQLQQLDMRRENALIGLQRIIEGSMFSPVAANRTAAVLLKPTAMVLAAKLPVITVKAKLQWYAGLSRTCPPYLAW